MRFLRSKITKRILGIVLVMGCSGIFLNGYVGVSEPVHAQQIQPLNTTTTTASWDTMSLWQILNIILKIIYILLWPLLVIAGLALDNTLVYASIFHLDAPLWKFWNIMKNFANFTLGFLVLFAIIKNLFMPKDEKGPMDIIKKTLIAGVLIQASWFLMAALVDVSTIATYAVGGLPLSVLKNTDIGKQKILSVNSTIDLNNFDVLNANGQGFKVSYSTTFNNQAINISPCRVEKSYIIGRQFGDPEYVNTNKFVGTSYAGYEVCVLFGNQLVMRKEGDLMQAITTETNVVTGGYNTMMNALVNLTGWDTNANLTNLMVNFNSGSTQDGFTKGNAFFSGSTSFTISDLIQKSKGFVGPLVTMYSSLLNFAQLTDTSTTTISGTSGIFLIKTGVAIALFFPLIALAIVLIARIGFLWLYIAGSPFLVIKKVFGDTIPKLGDFDKYLDLNNVFKMVFAPVVTVAALSISLIFMTALINGFKSGDNQQTSAAVLENLQTKPIPAIVTGNQAFQIGDSTSLEFKNFNRGGSLDRFSWLIVNFFAIGLLWTILFAAIKANALGDFIKTNVQDFGANVFQTLPIIPFNEGKGRVGIGSALKVAEQAPSQWISDRTSAQQTEVRNYLYPPETSTALTKETAAPIVTGLGTLTNITPETAKAVFTSNNITNPAENITANAQVYYDAINNMTNADQKKGAITAINMVAASPTFYADMEKTAATTKAKTDFETVIKTGTDAAAIQSILDKANATDKTTIDNYFTTANTTTYTGTTSDGKTTYTITQTKDVKNNTIYAVK